MSPDDWKALGESFFFIAMLFGAILGWASKQ